MIQLPFSVVRFTCDTLNLGELVTNTTHNTHIRLQGSHRQLTSVGDDSLAVENWKHVLWMCAAKEVYTCMPAEHGVKSLWMFYQPPIWVGLLPVLLMLRLMVSVFVTGDRDKELSPPVLFDIILFQHSKLNCGSCYLVSSIIGCSTCTYKFCKCTHSTLYLKGNGGYWWEGMAKLTRY